MTDLHCAMDKDCAAVVTHIDNKGYVYCTAHGAMRQFLRPCRKLTKREMIKLVNDQPIKY